MRKSLRSNLVVALGASLILVAGATTSAHRLDEYLQAARLAIDPERIEIAMDLTPGIAVAERVVADIDLDGDGSIDSSEARAHADRVRSAIASDVDGSPLDLTLVESSYPSIEAVRQGQGTIRLRLAARVPSLATGAHHLHYRNTHRSDIGVYLVNALVPDDDRVVVRAQRRDSDQHDLIVDYELRDVSTGRPFWWLLLGLASAGAVVALRSRSWRVG